MNTDASIHAINEKFNNILITDVSNNEQRLRCCVVCDEMLSNDETVPITLKDLNNNRRRLSASDWNKVSPLLQSEYSVRSENMEIQACTYGLLLSPRASQLFNHRSDDSQVATSFTGCKKCKYHLKSNKMPPFAIANNFAFGGPPACLQELNEVEIALLTPVKTYGYCFSYTGGVQKQLKGYLSYYKIKISSITKAVHTFKVAGLCDNIVVMYFGPMTNAQKQRARSRSKIRTKMVLRALEWLLVNNEQWVGCNINLTEIERSLQQPTIIDNSLSVQSVTDDTINISNNIEETDSFQVFFPDGTVSSLYGGQQSADDFKELVASATQNGYDIELKADLCKEAVKDYQNDNLVNACLLQFPYGKGGLHEQRMKADGSYTTNTDIKDYARHLSKISLPQFHEQLFVLILYNIVTKQNMVRSASLRTRSNITAARMAGELSPTQVQEAINRKRNGNHSNTVGSQNIGSQYLSAIDATSRAVPHTNEAAKYALRRAESMQHKYGVSSYFMTFAPDDDNSYLIQVFANNIIDDDRQLSSLDDEELTIRAKKRTQLRLRYPGFAAYNFELMLNLVIDEIIGWNLETGHPKPEGGYLGTPVAYLVGIEEQGRRSLHAHIQVWIEGYGSIRDGTYSKIRQVERESKKKLREHFDKISSSRLINTSITSTETAKCFPHDCKVGIRHRQHPIIASDQCLRNMRHRACEEKYTCKFATCPDCGHQWNNEQFLNSYMIHGIGVHGLNNTPDLHVRRLKAHCVEYQKPSSKPGPKLNKILDAAYNHHAHTKSCFKGCNKASPTKRKRQCHEDDECRYRFPKRGKRSTVIEDMSEDKIPWYDWRGRVEPKSIQELNIKRYKYDAFQNVCCPAISWSKIGGNSNICCNMYGPVSQYNIKYTTKGNQEEESQLYLELSTALMKITESRKHEVDSSESVRRVMAGAFAHQQQNIIGAPLASYLTRHESRFIFSHGFQWCPLRDLQTLLDGGAVNVSVSYCFKTPYFQSLAMHYLCRPIELQSISVHDFYSKYEIIRQTCRNRDTLLQFVSTPEFTHPSYLNKNNTHLQGVRMREREVLVQIFQHDFPDTAYFRGDILDPNIIITDETEKYCQLSLLLFCPFRSKKDLQISSSYTKRFQDAVQTSVINLKAQIFLQNIQDTKSNSFRMRRVADDLQRVTSAYIPADLAADIMQEKEKDDDDEDENEMVGPKLDELLRLTNADDNTNPNTSPGQSNTPETISLRGLRSKGRLQCGYKCLTKLTKPLSHDTFVTNQNNITAAPTPRNTAYVHTGVGSVPDTTELIGLLFSKTSRIRRTFQEITGCDQPVDVLEANGSVRSILDWGRKASLDNEQCRAFEIMASTFVLTFFNDAALQTGMGRDSSRHTLLKIKRQLNKLANRSSRMTQLIYFLHGPGGCGKSTVIELLLNYAAEYCSFMQDVEFTSKTIAVTAMTGVAASIIRGQTTHSALHLNNKRLNAEHIEVWQETRMVLIDEISFADKQDFIKIDKHLRILKQNSDQPYGGIDIIFSGDLRQLEPVGEGKKAIYDSNCAQFKGWVNCFTELKGLHRFNRDPAWGKLLMRLRDGTVTKEDIERINRDCVVKDDDIPPNTQYACYHNRDRDAINTALFQEMYERY